MEEALKALNAAEAAHRAAWEAVPLTIRKAIFVEGPATGFGSYIPREDNTFRSGETLHLYVEPIGFSYRPHGRLNAVDLSFDLAIYDEAGEELFKQERFSGFQYQGREKVRELYVNMEIKVTGLPSGSYTVGVTTRDLVTGDLGEFRLPFTTS